MVHRSPTMTNALGNPAPAVPDSMVILSIKLCIGRVSLWTHSGSSMRGRSWPRISKRNPRAQFCCWQTVFENHSYSKEHNLDYFTIIIASVTVCDIRDIRKPSRTQQNRPARTAFHTESNHKSDSMCKYQNRIANDFFCVPHHYKEAESARSYQN
jgi:hypothetical protein